MNIKKTAGIILAVAMLSGCGASNDTISLISRESGSGTRGAFIEIFGIEEKDSSGNKTDRTSKEAAIANKTDVMLTKTESDVNAIGYISAGSVRDSVKALKIDGAEPTAENIANGSYKATRTFNIVVREDISEAANDFVSYILSREGQEIVKSGYIPVNNSAEPYKKSSATGKIKVSGSSSVTPIMEKLKEGYEKVNTDIKVEILMSDSTAGISDAIAGTCDIGMSSRELKSDEQEKVKSASIAIDGIAVIVNLENPIDGLSTEQVKSIFTGETVSWSEINEK